MKKILQILLFILLMGCSSSNNKDNPVIGHVHTCMPNQPDSAYRYLEIHRQALSSAEDKAVAELLEYYINDLRTYNFETNSIATDILRNNHYYSDNYHQALALYYKGVFLIDKQEYEKTIELFHKAEKIADGMQWDHLLGMIYNKSSQVFYDLTLFNTSIEYADKSAHHFELAADHLRANRSHAFKIFSLLELEKQDEAEQLYQTTKNYALSINDIDFINHLCSEMMSVLLFFEDESFAESVYKDIKGINAGHMPLSAELLFLSKKYIENNRLDSAYYCLSQLNGNKNLNQTYDRVLQKTINSDYYRKKGDYKTAIGYMDERHNLLDSIISLNHRAALVKLESHTRNLQMQLLYEEEIAHKEQIVFWIILVTFILIVVIFIYRYKLKKQKVEMSNRIALVSEIVSELRDSNQTLLSKLDTHKEKENELKEHIESKLAYAKMFADLYYKFPNKPGTILKKMNEMIDLVPSNKEFTSAIINNVDLYYNNAIEKLTQQHTDLANTEILFSALIIAGFSAHEMSLILNSNSLDAVYTRKYRLKQKLNINKNTDVEEYLLGFVQG